MLHTIEERSLVRKPPILLLVVSSGERLLRFLRELQPLVLRILVARDCHEARLLLEASPEIDVLITDVSHPDGNWCDILTWVVDEGHDAQVVVTSTAASEILWSEVLWRGVYDMLVEPLEPGEVRQAIEGALRAKHVSCEPMAAAS